MDNQDKLIDDVEVIAKKIKELHDLAYVRYSRLVDAVLTDSLTDEKQIEHILDGILDFGDDLRFLELSSCMAAPSQRTTTTCTGTITRKNMRYGTAFTTTSLILRAK